MMVMVLLPGGGSGGGYGHFRGWRLVGWRPVVAGLLLAVAGRLRRRLGQRTGRDHRCRLAAQGIVDEDRPGHHRDPEQPEHARQNLRGGSRELRQTLSFVLAEGGVQIIR